MKNKEWCRILSQEEIGTDIYSMWLETPSIGAGARPGQFVSLYCRDKSRLLPRPISLCEIDKDRNRIRLVYRVAGKGTEEFSKMKAGEEISLLPREFSVLYKLLSHPRKVFTRSELLNEYWDMDNDSGLRTVDVYVARLRNKLAACKDFEIVTVHGFGYKAVLK